MSEPERLVTDRYGAYQAEHGLGYGPAGELWMRANYGAPAPVEVGRPFAGLDDLVEKDPVAQHRVFVARQRASDPPHRADAWSKARPTIARTKSRRNAALA